MITSVQAGTVEQVGPFKGFQFHIGIAVTKTMFFKFKTPQLLKRYLNQLLFVDMFIMSSYTVTTERIKYTEWTYQAKGYETYLTLQAFERLGRNKQVTCSKWHVASSMWQVACGMWQATCGK